MSRDIIYTVSDKINNNPVLWLSADRNITLNGNNVSVWGDRSGNGYDASQSTPANQPLYVPNALNGKPVLRFDGTNDSLISSNILPIGQVDNKNLFIVYKASTPIRYWYQGLFTSNNDQYYGIIYCELVSTQQLYLFPTNSGRASSVFKSNDYNFHIIHRSDHQTITRTYQDGILLNTFDPAVINYTPDVEYIVGRNTSSNYGDYFKGDIAEIIIYNQALNDQERIMVEQYLTKKYNII